MHYEKIMTNQAEEKLLSFLQQFPSQQHGKDETLLRSGSRLEYFYYVKSGAIKMMTTSGRGQNLVLHIFNPGATLPLLAVINDNQNAYDFVTVVPTVVHKIPYEHMTAFLQQNVDVLYAFNLRLLHGLQGLLDRVEQSTFVPAYNQVAGLLLYFSRHFADNSTASNQKVIELRVTHQEIAEWLGLSRENVSIQMKKLERDGLIRKKEKFVEIVDVAKLQELANPYSATRKKE